MAELIGYYIGVTIVWGGFLGILFWLVRSVWKYRTSAIKEKSRYVIHIMAFVILIETLLIAVLMDTGSTLRRDNESIATSTAQWRTKLEEYDRANKELYSENELIRKDNKKILEANKNLSEALVKFCPNCVITEQ